MVEFYAGWIRTISGSSSTPKTGLAEDDWLDAKILTRELGAKIQVVVGDDIFVTNPEISSETRNRRYAANCDTLIGKVNQTRRR